MLPSPGTPQHVEITWDVVYCLQSVRAVGRYETIRLFLLHSFQHKYLEPFKSSIYGVNATKAHHTNKMPLPLPKVGGVSLTFHGNWSHQLTRAYHAGPPEVLMKNGNRRQLFPLRTLSPLPHERALSNTSFSRASVRCHHHLALTLPLARRVCPHGSCRERLTH